MKKNIYPVVAFLIVFLLHGAYLIWQIDRVDSQWASIDETSPASRYFAQQDYFMSLSYGFAAAFTVYSFMQFKNGKRGGLKGALGGITLTGILYFGGCFLLGCCGSPMLPVYLGLFGSSYAGFTKPIVLVVTTVSIAISWFWMERRKGTAKDQFTLKWK